MTTLHEIVSKSETSDEFIRQFMHSLVLTSKNGDQIQSGDKFECESSFRDFSELSDLESADLGNVLKEILTYIKPSGGAELPDDLADPSLYEHMVDMIDFLLQRADFQCDKVGIQGDLKKLAIPLQLSLAVDKNRIMRSNVQDIPKPQKEFISDIDNSRERPFRPRIEEKPFAQVSLDLSQKFLENSDAEVIAPSVYFPHPYEAELRDLQYPKEQLADPTKSFPSMPPLDQPLVYIDDEDALQRMIDELSGVTEIAVDLQNHSYRSFQGFACLMQVSSRHRDYVIDVLKLRLKMHAFNTILANPEIVKVFHGCEDDILWLQRDLGCYVVNCFDTYHAAKLLKYPTLSLSHQVKFHCGISLNKKHQMSDWRIRPLSKEMIDYARDGTHFLLYVYDCLRTEMWKSLGEQAHKAVLDASCKTCSKRYEKEPFWPLGYRKLLNGSRKATPKVDTVSDIQDTVMGALWDWRDATARSLDESTDYVMSNSELLRLGTVLPRTQSQAEDTGPLSSLVRERINEVLGVIAAQMEIGPTPTRILPSGPSGQRGGSVRITEAEVRMGQSLRGESHTSGKDTCIDKARLYGRQLKTPVRELNEGAWALEGVNGTGNADSMFTFPAVVQSPIMFIGDAHQSPVMTADEIYEMAGWHTPSADMEGLNSPTLILEEAFRDQVADMRESNLMKSESTRLHAQHMCSRNNLLHEPTPQAQASPSVGNRKTAASEEIESINVGAAKEQTTSVEVGEGDDRVLVGVPSSMEEIYEISNRNRKRNKEKKRVRDAEDDEVDGVANSVEALATHAGKAEDMTSSAAQHHKNLESESIMGATLFDETIYFKSIDQQADISMKGTLDFVESVGWVRDGEEKNRIRDAHLQDQSTEQEGEEYGQGGGGGGGGGSGHNSARKDDRGGVRDSKERNSSGGRRRPSPGSTGHPDRGHSGHPPHQGHPHGVSHSAAHSGGNPSSHASYGANSRPSSGNSKSRSNAGHQGHQGHQGPKGQGYDYARLPQAAAQALSGMGDSMMYTQGAHAQAPHGQVHVQHGQTRHGGMKQNAGQSYNHNAYLTGNRQGNPGANRPGRGGHGK